MNHVFLVGRTVADSHLRYSEKGKAIASFGLAVTRWRPTASDSHPSADFVDVVVFDRLAEKISPHLSRGRLVGVDGRLSARSYVRDGMRRKVVEVIAGSIRFLDKPAKGREGKIEG